MKILKWSLVAVVLLVIIGLLVFYLTLDRVVRRTVESEATKSLATPTTLNAASVAPLRGKVELHDLQIANPEGYVGPHIFTLNDVNLAVSYHDLRQDPIRVDTITIKNPVITLEQKDLKTNIQALMDRLPKGAETPASGDTHPIHLVISHLNVETPTVVLRPGFPGLPQELKLNLPTLALNDVGTGEGNRNGAAIKDVVMLVLTESAARAAQSDQLPPELRQLLTLDVKQLSARMKDELKIQVDKVGGQLTKQIGGQLGTVIGEAVKNPEQLKSDPGALLRQGLDAALEDRTGNRTPATQPARTRATAPKSKR